MTPRELALPGSFCETCDAPVQDARPERVGELVPPTCAGPCPACGAAPYFERHPTPYTPQPGDFVVSRENLYRKVRLG